jgi:hypothetical protein
MKCCNPKCEAPFDYREGRLIRFSRKAINGKPSGNQSLIEHFWLCGKCSQIFVFECKSGKSLEIKMRNQESAGENLSHFVSAA